MESLRAGPLALMCRKAAAALPVEILKYDQIPAPRGVLGDDLGAR